MKTIYLSFVLSMLFATARAQTPASTVYDPINGAQLVSMGTMLVTLKEQGAEVVKTLETANQIRSAAKIVEFIRAVEDSYCVIQDLDLYNTRAKAMFKTDRNCFDNFIYQIALTAIENAISQTQMAATSANMSLGDRSNTINNAFKSITESNEALNDQKEKLKKKVDARDSAKKSMSNLNRLF